ncbi:MAG: GerMN domain-containing protein [Clostridia bacterium]
MTKVQKTIVFFLLVSMTTVFMACSVWPWGSPVQEQENIDDNGQRKQEGKAPPISPLSEKTSNEETDVTLFFRYNQDDYLASDTRKIKVIATERVEKVIVEELIKGPNPGKLELTPLFHPSTKVVAVSDNNDYLFVTLSREFLEPPMEVPDNWQEDKNWVDEVNRTRRLAVYSIVNTLTELGKFNRVQILIQGDIDDERGERPKRKEMGFTDGNEEKQNTLLEPLARNTSLILTPMNTVEAMLNAFMEKDWGKVYQYTASKDTNNVPKPEDNDFKSTMASLDPTLENFRVRDEHVSNDGQNALVTIDFSIKMKDGKVFEKTYIPIKLIREKEIWKVIFPSVSSIYENE